MTFPFLYLLTYSPFNSPGTPYLSVHLDGPSNMIWGERITITMKVTYEGLTNDNGEAVLAEAKPIIIRNLPFDFQNFQLHRRCHDYDRRDSDNDDPEWELYLDDQLNLSYKLVDGPDIEVNVTDETLFLSLQPEESWTEGFTIDLTDLYEDTAVGDSYRFQYWGGYVEWWIWGSREEHANTTVKVPPWRGDVVDPVGNEGKPDIVIPGSNTVEFVVVESTKSS